MTATFKNSRLGGSPRLAMAAAVVTATIAGLAAPAAAGLTFDSQFADATWTNTQGRSNTFQMSPGRDNASGVTTEYLKTSINGRFCAGNALLDVTLVGTELAGDLAGVDLSTLAATPTATVNRTTTLIGTITRTPTSGKTCGTLAGAPVTTLNPVITLTGSWAKPASATLMTYSGTDCGGTGTCRYTDAAATGSFAFGGGTVTLGGTRSNQWMWSGVWDLSALCSPLPGYPCS